MDLLATIDHLEDRMQQPVDLSQGMQALTDASGLVRRIARQVFSFVENETIILAGGDRKLVLPERPLVVDDTHPLTVVELGDLTDINLTVIEGRDFTRIGNELSRAYPWYVSTRRTMGWPFVQPLGVWTNRVQATYSHGYAAIPDDVVAVVLDVAQVGMSNPDALKTKTVGATTETFAVSNETLGRDLADHIRAKLGLTGRRRGAFSIRQS